MRGVLLLLAVAACDPAYGARVTLRDPSNHPIENATLAIACPDGPMSRASMAVRSKHDGTAVVANIGGTFPMGCDVFVAKPGFRTHRVTYRELCPNGPEHCDRFFTFDLMLDPD